MAAAGVNLLFSASEMAVVGLTEVFSKLRTILVAAKDVKALLKNRQPALLILIDYPDFNLHIAKSAKKYHIPVLYYISPQVWAWRKGRIKKIAKRVDRMAVILPFEKDFYRNTSLPVDYVGHPLLDGYDPDTDKNADMTSPDLAQGRVRAAILPGSRREEIRNLLPIMVSAAEIIARRFPALHCVLPLAPGVTPSFIQPFIENTRVTIEIRRGNIYGTLKGCHLALVTSGTATLEVAIAGIPMVIIYKMSRLSYWVGRALIDVPFIGLVNLVAAKRVSPELIQKEANGERLAQEALALLENPALRETVFRQMKQVRQKLGQGGASEKTADIAIEMIGL